MKSSTMRRMSLILLFLSSCSTPLLGQANPETLKSAHQLLSRAVRSADISIIEAMVHPRAMGYFREAQFPAKLSPRGTSVAPSVIEDLSSFVRTELQSEFVVVGLTGIVCSTIQLSPTEGKLQYGRSTLTYSYQDGKWRVVSWHSSFVPGTVQK